MFPSREDTALSAWAHTYAEGGWPVFPIIPRDKRPIPTNGFKAATTDHDLITAWWAERPDANIGLPTGQHFDVLDIDGEAGVAFLRRFWKERGLDYRHPGPLSLTGKGWHALFAPTGHGNGTNLGGTPENQTKLDFRGIGGYIVAPPSIHPFGHSYQWDKDRGIHLPLPEPPDWLIELLDQDQNPVARNIKAKAPTPVIVKGLDIDQLRALDRKQVIETDNSKVHTRKDFRATSILEVCANQRIELRHRSRYYVGKCPFHQDDTPSFTIYPDNNTFKCYGCGARGDSWDLEHGTHL